MSCRLDLVVSVGTSGTFPYIHLPMQQAQVNDWPSAEEERLRPTFESADPLRP